MSLDRRDAVNAQYADSTNFSARVDLHARFSTNQYGWTRWVFDRLDLGPHARVLEMGCGPGWLWRGNADRVPAGWRVVVADMSAGMAGEAAGAIDDARFAAVVADAQDVPSAGETFDCVVANHMLYHVPDVDRALSEFSRVLAPDGVLFAATNGQQHMIEMREMMIDVGMARPDGSYIRMFGLESGPPIVARHFDDVVVDRYEDFFAITEVEPVLDYFRSMSSFWSASGEAAEAELRRRIAAAIERDGVFNISKDAGLIRAKRR